MFSTLSSMLELSGSVMLSVVRITESFGRFKSDLYYRMPQVVFRFLMSLLIEGRAIMCVITCLSAFSIGKQWEACRRLSSVAGPVKGILLRLVLGSQKIFSDDLRALFFISILFCPNIQREPRNRPKHSLAIKNWDKISNLII